MISGSLGCKGAAAAALFLAAALTAGPAAAQDCPRIDAEAQKTAAAECRARGGEWAKFGIRAHLCGVYSCAPRTRDGGRIIGRVCIE